MAELPIEPRKVFALIQRDMNKWSTYKTQAITSIIGGLLGVASWGFIGTFNQAPVASNSGIFGPSYSTSYVSFLVSGILVANLILPLNQGVQQRVNPWTLETILMSGIRAPTFVLGTVGWQYLLSIILFIPQLLLGIFFFGAQFNVNIISTLVAIAISSLVIFSLSMISAGLRIVTKTSDPISWAVNISASLFAGMTFPISHLDSGSGIHLSYISYFLPQTWIYDIMRISVLNGGSLADPSVIIPFAITFAFALFLLPMSIRVFRWSIRRAKRDGTLGMY